MQKKTIIALTSTAVIVGLVGIGFGIASAVSNPQVEKVSVAPEQLTAEEAVEEVVTAPSTPPTTTNDLLVYLIEEEKLAHDVYSVLYETWGSNIFSNILASETQHQDQVLSLLTTYGLEDVRSAEVGVFTNPELQALYNQLIAQGLQSKTAAMEVGVLIEQTDIADLTEAMGTTTDPVILQTLESLKKASENHLAAFQKQI